MGSKQNIILITNINNDTGIIRAVNCSDFQSKFLGLMFKQHIEYDEGVLLIASGNSRLNPSIHMLFMNFDIAVIWLNSDLVVVDKKIAIRWHPFYMPNRPAKYTLEIHSDRIKDFKIGDKISLLYEKNF